MIESITIAATGLRGFEQGLRTISNNTANLNTPGFKGASTQFADLFYGSNPQAGTGSAALGQPGYGLNTLGTRLNFTSGQLQNTGNPLDLAINGQGFFTLRDSQGVVHYTQDGQFKFDSSGTLISVSTGEQVMALATSGNLAPILLTGLQTFPPRATTTVKFSGNLSSSAPRSSVGSINVVDSTGSSHSLTLNFDAVSGAPGNWTATLMDGSTQVGTTPLTFNDGRPADGGVMSFNYSPAGAAPMALSFDFSKDVTSFDMGAESSLAVVSQDGYGVGTLTKQEFDASGTLVLTYSNGQTQKGGQLALAQFGSIDDVAAAGDNQFVAKSGNGWLQGIAGTGAFGSIRSGMVETSNIDLSQEFANLVIMQRGYQACSQVVSTASEMLAALFGVMGK